VPDHAANRRRHGLSIKKYQIFISSTFVDLALHRQAITKSILDLAHIPAGMELFSAADQEQFDYIKQIIDQCDYYVLVLAGRYGSRNAEGISYTELEYDYAVKTRKTVLAFIVKNVGNLEAQHVDQADEADLNRFKDKVKTGRIVNFWTNIDDLNAAVIIALTKAFNQYPQVGWVRGDTANQSENAQRISLLSERIRDLEVQPEPTVSLTEDRALINKLPLELSGEVAVEILFDTKDSSIQYRRVVPFSWGDIAKYMTLELIDGAKGVDCVEEAVATLFRKMDRTVDNVWIDKETQITMLITLEQKGVVLRKGGFIHASEAALDELRNSVVSQRTFGANA